MAQSNATLRNSIITSIYGRRMGLDKGDYLVGPNGYKEAVTDLTSASTATSIPNNGIVNITGTSLMTSGAGGGFLLSNPEPGIRVRITNVNAMTSAASPGSTAMTLERPSTAFVIYSSEGTTMTTINLGVAGCAVELTGLSTGVYMVTARTPSSGLALNGTT